MICRMWCCCVLILDMCIGLCVLRFLVSSLVVCCDMFVRNFWCNVGGVFFSVMISVFDLIFLSIIWIVWFLRLSRFLNMNIWLMIFCVRLVLYWCMFLSMFFLCMFVMKFRILVVVWMLFIGLCFRLLLLDSRFVSMLLSLCSVVGWMLLSVVICSSMLLCSCLVKYDVIFEVWLWLRCMRIVVMICGCLFLISLVIVFEFIYFRFLMLFVLLFCRMWLISMLVLFLLSVFVSIEWMYLFELSDSVVCCLVFFMKFCSMFLICLCVMFFSVVIVVLIFWILCGVRNLNICVVFFLLIDISSSVFLVKFLVFIGYLVFYDGGDDFWILVGDCVCIVEVVFVVVFFVFEVE